MNLLCPNCGVYVTLRREMPPRVKELLPFVVEGMSNPEISKRMGISVRTVKAHMNRAMTYFSTRNRVALAVAIYKESCRVENSSKRATSENSKLSGRGNDKQRDRKTRPHLLQRGQ
jgi:DNA-binding CsgD family transcriptional regulator